MRWLLESAQFFSILLEAKRLAQSLCQFDAVDEARALNVAALNSLRGLLVNRPRIAKPCLPSTRNANDREHRSCLKSHRLLVWRGTPHAHANANPLELAKSLDVCVWCGTVKIVLQKEARCRSMK